MDQETMFPRIEVRRFTAVGNKVMERSGSDDPHRILKRSSRPPDIVVSRCWIFIPTVIVSKANRSYVMGPLPVCVKLFGSLFGRTGSRFLSVRQTNASHGQACQRRAIP